MIQISKERLLGMIELCGSFGGYKKKNGAFYPRFVVKMVPENRIILEAIRGYLKVNARVREYISGGRHYVILTISSIADLKTKVVSVLKGGLFGAQAEKFEQWLKQFRYLDSK